MNSFIYIIKVVNNDELFINNKSRFFKQVDLRISILYTLPFFKFVEQ